MKLEVLRADTPNFNIKLEEMFDVRKESKTELLQIEHI